MRYSWVALAFAWGWAADAGAATLPAHDPIDVVIVADEVNPNGLSDGDLTQPGDLEPAIGDPASGISIASITYSDSACVDDAVQALEGDAADVLVYFAHQPARDCAGGDGQARLTDAAEGLLRRGGGVVVFHHGIYTAPGKEAILELFGGTANAIFWDTTTGQDIINVAPDHFVTTNEVSYTGTRAFADPGFGIAMDEYPVFNNTPDERYPGLQFITVEGEDRTILFASDYQGAQVIGYDLHRPDWAGHVVLYQSGEYQPNALDDLNGSNFQILANAIFYVATTMEEPVDPTDGESSSGGGETTGGASTSGASNSSNGGTGMSGPTSDTDTEGSAMNDSAEGCGCRSTSGSGFALLLLLLTCATARRRP